MGNDGGSIPDRRDLVRSKPKAEQADRANQTRARWFFCALSKQPLREPIVSDALGKLYNKDAVLEFLLDRGAYGDGEVICGHIRSLKDIKTLTLTPNTTPRVSMSTDADAPAPYACPLTQKEMTGHVPFVYLASCGCVFSQAGLKAVSSPSTPPTVADVSPVLDVCPQCATKFDAAVDVRMLNPPPEDEDRMRAEMEARRPKPKKSKKRKAVEGTDADADAPPAKAKKAAPTPAPSTNGSIAAASRAVQSSLAMEEAKRKAGMSAAVQSLYGNKDGPKRKETFMTMGTFTRYA